MTIQECVQTVRVRQQRQWMWHCLSWGLVIGGVVGCSLAIAGLTNANSVSWPFIAASMAFGPIFGLVYAAVRPRRMVDAATTIDRKHGLKDGMATALHFMNQNDPSAIRELQIEDTTRRTRSIDPARVAPIVMPKPWAAGLTLTCVAALLAVLAAKPSEVVANVVPNEVVSSQALRVADSLEELEEFNQEELDPEIEELLKDLAKNIEDLKQPEMDPREALAKLSEMEAALQEQQEKLNQQDTEAALQQVGDAMTLAEQMQSAGEAMSKGEMQKAAEELAKLEMPDLDRKTEKSITEELDRVENSSNGAAKKQLKEAIQQLSQGLSSGDRSKFKDAMEGLAGECKKQGRRKKLSDLLRKQCQCLSECKGECQSECTSKTDSNKKAGKTGDSVPVETTRATRLPN